MSRIDGIQVLDIPLTQLEIDDHFREDIGELDKLVASYGKHGLLQPIGVQQVSFDPPKYQVRFGRRRLLAAIEYAKLNGESVDKISARLVNPKDQLEMRLIEQAENLYRKDLTPMEKLRLRYEIHKLHIEKYGSASGRGATKPGTGGHRLSDTADFLGVAPVTIRRDLELAAQIDELPETMQEELNKARTTKEIQNFLDKSKRTTEDFIRVSEAKELAGTDDGIRQRIDSFVVGDFFEKISSVPDGSIDLVELDPPYGIDIVGRRASHGKAGIDLDTEYNEIDERDYPEFMDRVLAAIYPKMKENSWLICWTSSWWMGLLSGLHPELVRRLRKSNPGLSIEDKHLLSGLFSKHSLKCSGLPNVWVKDGGSGMAQSIDITLGSNFEPFFHVRKGRPELQKKGRPNVFQFARVPAIKKVHTAERPILLIQEILQTFARPGDRILVPFAGSGKTLLAAWELSMFPIGFDLSQTSKDKYILMIQGDGRVY